MTDNAELQAKIAAISGKINQHKQQQQPFAPPPYYSGQQYSPQQYRSHARWAPYGRGSLRPPHKNRSLVLNSSSALASASAANDGQDAAAVNSPAYITTRSTNHQLMTKDTYDREQQQKLEHLEQQRAAKRQKRDNQERSRILHHVRSDSGSGTREMVIDGIRFQLTSNGSKLIRVPGKSVHVPGKRAAQLKATDSTAASKETPKKYRLVGVDFFRTKSGNLVRGSALTTTARSNSARPQCENFTKHGTESFDPYQTGHAWASTTKQRHRTWHAGTCPFGPRCHFAHDPHKVAICKDYLKTGTCMLGANCDLSHERTYHRVPACQYFLRGTCTNDACRYPHIFVSPAANVCRAFALLGYCAKGPECDRRHVHECPDYANNGFCANRESDKCLLPHPDRASILRKAAERQAKMGSDAESDVSSDAEEDDADMEDIDSDDTHELSQQQDFVGFS